MDSISCAAGERDRRITQQRAYRPYLRYVFPKTLATASRGYHDPRYQDLLCRTSAAATQPLMPYHAGYLSMGQYVKGDVLLASVALDDRTAPKTWPWW